MKLRYQICLFVIISLLVINSSLATSYSLWIITRQQSGHNIVTSGCFLLSFDDLDSNDPTKSTSINLDPTYPIPDAYGENLAPYKVTVTNTCSVAADYKLIISDFNSNTLPSENIRYYLKKNDGTTFTPDYLTTLTPYTMEASTKATVETKASTNTFNASIKNSYILATGKLNPSDAVVYELRMWVEDTYTGMDKEFGAVVSLESYATNIQY